jgi:pyruvate dehydrogenase E1 component alpha subunit
MTSGTTANERAVLPVEGVRDDLLRVLRPDGSTTGDEPAIADAALREIYGALVRTRAVDQRASQLQHDRRIGFHIGSVGEEAAIIGSAYALAPEDWVFPCHRELGAGLLRGMTLASYCDGLFGNRSDRQKGRQMPDHYAHRHAHLASVSSPIGTQIIHAVGFAWGAKIKNENIAVLVYFGDGATSSADFHNGLNFAGVFKAPCVLFCRNNGWALSNPGGGTPAARQTASETLAVKGGAYGVPAIRCDGNDVLAVIRATQTALARARSGEGATLVEAVIARRDAGAEADPLVRVRRLLARRVGWDDAAQAELERAVAAEIDGAVARAEAEPPPPRGTLFEDVFAEMPWHLAEQRAELDRVSGDKSRR